MKLKTTDNGSNVHDYYNNGNKNENIMLNAKITKENNKKVTSYPYLGRTESNEKDYIVLFVSSNSGVLISDGSGTILEMGEYSEDWEEKEFEYFKGKVELSNDLY